MYLPVCRTVPRGSPSRLDQSDGPRYCAAVPNHAAARRHGAVADEHGMTEGAWTRSPRHRGWPARLGQSKVLRRGATHAAARRDDPVTEELGTAERAQARSLRRNRCTCPRQRRCAAVPHHCTAPRHGAKAERIRMARRHGRAVRDEPLGVHSEAGRRWQTVAKPGP
jgi:hypothetical protein